MSRVRDAQIAKKPRRLSQVVASAQQESGEHGRAFFRERDCVRCDRRSRTSLVVCFEKSLKQEPFSSGHDLT